MLIERVRPEKGAEFSVTLHCARDYLQYIWNSPMQGLADILPTGETPLDVAVGNALIAADSLLSFYRGVDTGRNCAFSLFRSAGDYVQSLEFVLPAVSEANWPYFPEVVAAELRNDFNFAKDIAQHPSDVSAIALCLRDFLKKFVSAPQSVIAVPVTGLCENFRIYAKQKGPAAAKITELGDNLPSCVFRQVVSIDLGVDAVANYEHTSANVNFPIWVDRSKIPSVDYHESHKYEGAYLEARIELAKRCLAILDCLIKG